MDRRQYIALAGSGLAASVAGCLGGNGDSDDDTNNSNGTGGGNTTDGGGTGTGNGNQSDSTDGGENGTGNGNESDSTDDGTTDDEPTDGDGEDGTDDSDDGTGEDDSGTDDPTAGPKAVVERYYELWNSNQDVENLDEVLALLEPIFHSQSPFLEFIENSDETGDQDGEQSYPTDPDLEITERDLSAEELSSSYGLTLIPYVDEADLDVIAGNNAVVQQATIISDSGDTERTPYFFVTQEDGEWVIFLTYTEEVTSG